MSTEEGKAFADFHDISFIETSSKSSLYVQEAFAMIAREIYDLLIEGRIHVQEGYVLDIVHLLTMQSNRSRWDGVKPGPNTTNPNQNQSIDITQNSEPRRSGCCGSSAS